MQTRWWRSEDFSGLVFPHRIGPPLCLGNTEENDGEQATKARVDCHDVVMRSGSDGARHDLARCGREDGNTPVLHG